MEGLPTNWSWYIAGPLIGLFVPLLLIVGNKLFGISTSFVHACSIVLPKSKQSILNYDARKNSWKFYFVIGIAIGAFITVFFLSEGDAHFLPQAYGSLFGYVQLFIGGLLVGFGTRYADGCTSGHAITGISLLNMASLKSAVSFFVGGVIYTWIAVYLL